MREVNRNVGTMSGQKGVAWRLANTHTQGEARPVVTPDGAAEPLPSPVLSGRVLNLAVDGRLVGVRVLGYLDGVRR